LLVIPNPFTDGLLNLALPWAPTIDGVEITQQPIDAFANGAYDSSVPIMLGSNAAESIMFVYMFLQTFLKNVSSFDHAEYDLLLTAIFQSHVLDVTDEYPYDDDYPLGALYELMTHLLFTCANRRIALSAAKSGTPAVYLYFFNHSLSFDAWGPNYQFCVDFACHGVELPFVFDSAAASGFNFTVQEKALSVSMGTYWTNFAKSGNPNSPVTPALTWPPHLQATLQDIQFRTPTPLVQGGLFESYCNCRSKGFVAW